LAQVARFGPTRSQILPKLTDNRFLAMSRYLVCALMLLSVSAAVPKTCGELKGLYKTNTFCGKPDQVLTTSPCPYVFEKPKCAAAGVQAPRDLSTTGTGLKTPKITTLSKADAMILDLANVHFHLGAEHKSDQYNDDTASKAYDVAHAAAAASGSHRRLSSAPRPGFMCPTTSLTAEDLAPYTFVHCQGDVAVGKSYEFHYVRSSAGSTGNPDVDVNDGLGGAANGRALLNPYIAVQAQIFQIINSANAPVGPNGVDVHTGGWKINAPHTNAVMYPGSTTGTSHDNEVCSPYAVTWHVDKTCHKISAAAFDNMCKNMKDDFGLSHDLSPHGSRKILDAKFVVPAAYVKPLA